MSRRIFLILALAGSLSPAFAQTKPGHAARSNSPFTSALVPWSLEPAMGATEARLGMRATAPARKASQAASDVETITVFGLKRAPTEEALHHDAPTAEAWQSDAAQPVVPGFGQECSYKNGCFDSSQKGLFSSVPSLFGGD